MIYINIKHILTGGLSAIYLCALCGTGILISTDKEQITNEAIQTSTVVTPVTSISTTKIVTTTPIITTNIVSTTPTTTTTTVTTTTKLVETECEESSDYEETTVYDETYEEDIAWEDEISNETIDVTTEKNDNFYSNVISYYEYIMLCNCVAHEAGSEWINVYEKAKVVEVIMNRVQSDVFPNTIYDVLTQNGQFVGVWEYVEMSDFSSQVTESVINAVDLYFSNPSQFNHGYLYFEGDGTTNYFS